MTALPMLRSAIEPPSAEARERMRQAKLGGKHSPEHRARISESLRQWHSSPESKLRGVSRVLTDAERADFRVLREKGKYPVEQALTMVGRSDLIGYAPTPLPPVSTYRKLTAPERRAYWLTWREAASWEHALSLIGRADLVCVERPVTAAMRVQMKRARTMTKRARLMALLTEDQRRDYRTLRKACFSRDEALRSIGAI